METDDIKLKLTMILSKIENHIGYRPKGYFAGGCIASLIQKETPHDYDFWFKTQEDFDLTEQALEKAGIITTKTKYSTTIILPTAEKIQFVKHRIGLPEEVVKTFDFLHTHNYYDPETDKLVCQFGMCESKSLRFVGDLLHPVNTMQRALKFAARGYKMSPEDSKEFLEKIKDYEGEFDSSYGHGSL